MNKKALLERVHQSNHDAICVNCDWFTRKDCSCQCWDGACIHFFGHKDNLQAKDFFKPTKAETINVLSKGYKPIPTFSKIWRS